MFCGNNLRVISQKVSMGLILNMCWENTLLKSSKHLSGTNEFTDLIKFIWRHHPYGCFLRARCLVSNPDWYGQCRLVARRSKVWQSLRECMISHVARLSLRGWCYLMPLDLYIKLGPYKLSLQASVDHHGYSMSSGHYTASINWCGKTFHCNDNKITECNVTNTYNSSTAYIHLYKLMEC